MLPHHNRRFPVDGARLLVSVLAVSAMATAGPAYAGEGEIEVISANVSPGWLYSADPPDYEWNVPTPNTILSQGSVVEGGPGTKVWFIAPTGIAPGAELDWSGSLRDQDFSIDGRADATFFPGGTMAITGQVWDLSTFKLLHDGPLLEAEVSAFRVTETHDNDVLTFQPGCTVHPTGGYLKTNPHGMNLVGDYFFQGTIPAAESDGSGIEDFENDIQSTGGFQFTLAQVPEPTTAALVAGAFAFLAGRRRRAV